VTITPSSITTSLPPGGSTTVTVTISGPGAQSGATICFTVALVGAPPPAPPPVICRTEHCITLPTCPCVAAPPGLAHWWPFEETPHPTIPVTTTADIAGGRDGDIKPGPLNTPGSPTSVAGIVGNAFGFDGSSSFVEVPDGPGTLSFGNPGQEFSIDAWIKVQPGDESGVRPIVDKRNEIGGRVAGYQLYLRDGKLSFQLADASVSNPICDVNPNPPSPTTSCTNYESTANVANGQPHHVAVTVERTGASPRVRLYVDGALVFTGPTRIHANNNASLLIGRNNPAVSFAGQFFKGVIDEVEIFNRVLTQQEIQDIYNAGRGGKCRAEICVEKFNDLDGDGQKDPNEPPLFGWKFDIKDSQGNTVGTVTTDKEKAACRLVPAPGMYTVTEQVQSGWMPTTPNPQTVTVQPGQTVNLTFGNKEVGRCDLAIKKEVRPRPLVSGQPATVIITVTNVGNAPCPGPTTVTETVPPGLTLVSASGPGWTCVGNVCTYPLPIPAGGSVSVTYTFNVTAPPGTVIENCATLSNQNDQNAANNRDCVQTDVVGQCDLTIRKTVSPNPVQSGQPVTVTLTVMNVGNGACGPDTVVQDPPTSGLTVPSQSVSVNPPGPVTWSCNISNNGLTCVSASAIPAGYTATFTFTATVTAPAGSQIQNCATVSNPNDINSQNNQSCVTLQVTGCVTPPANMTAWWPFDEPSGTTANDLAGVPNNGTLVNGPTHIAGMVGGALRFDGVNDHVTVADHAELNFGTGDLSIDAWIRTTGTTDILPIVDKRATVGNLPRGYTLFLFNGRLAFQLADAVGTGFTNYISNASVNDGNWHHVAVTVQRTGGSPSLILYVDGMPAPGGTFTNPRTGNLTNTAQLWIGRRIPVPGAQAARYFIGDIDEVELFNRALSQQEIQAIFQAGSAGKCKGCIEGMKWNDANGNGVINPGEAGLSGWTIQLTGPVNQTTTTGTGGTYRFCGLPPGTYTVAEVLLPGWVRTFPPTPGTHTVTLAANQVVTGRNFGNRRVIVFPDFVVRNLTAIPPGIPGGNVALGSQVLVRFDIVNQGTGEAGPARHEIRLFIPEGAGHGQIDRLLATVMTGPLAAGASQSFNQLVTIPRDVPTGSARIRVIADAPNGISESEEGNNGAEFRIILIRPGP
jgi:uncharacterized repeat protein (TIGR01451 family)